MIIKLLSIIIGSIFIAAGINGLLVPYHLLDGGIIGISLIFKYIFGFHTGLTIILLSIPMYVFAWFFARPYFYNSLHGLLASSFFIDFLSPMQFLNQPPIFLSALIGGFLVGTGIGIMLRQETSTGPIDLLAQFIAKITNVNVGIIILIIDSIILLFGGYMIGGHSFLYSIVTVIAVGITTAFFTMKTPVSVK
ncbi:YitT family protein [Bacillus taeanensis]|uniref:YitT family protein n=1 Tax=Bacillus taeanensis TaxID=273032 RepID=A0A366XZN9_9BACI|nr:YitT family protein [Bacillus taeanensis]RBW71038.1 hypothetical protein DS031_03335 [Bacillus taeanensis]